VGGRAELARPRALRYPRCGPPQCGSCACVRICRPAHPPADRCGRAGPQPKPGGTVAVLRLVGGGDGLSELGLPVILPLLVALLLGSHGCWLFRGCGRGFCISSTLVRSQTEAIRRMSLVKGVSTKVQSVEVVICFCFSTLFREDRSAVENLGRVSTRPDNVRWQIQGGRSRLL
jgi:hypothetical protein